ncbi:MAG: hypothetical protein A3H25_15485 [Sphingomonadales bacterium RIFCSPLOWO2_12_FULL_63_15]|nr:MAG: hypothetical protein A3H25_15485 [Sphingomonadales bacterium RIFCSPLOWO2_12_FULL_63_15]
MEEVQLSSAIHLTFDEFELDDLPFGLAVGPVRHDRRADSGDILDYATGERSDKADACALDPRIEIGFCLTTDHRMETLNNFARFNE